MASARQWCIRLGAALALLVIVASPAAMAQPKQQPHGELNGVIAAREESRAPRGTVIISNYLKGKGEVSFAGGDEDAMVAAGSSSSYHDNTPRISADGRIMFFNSTRYGGRSWAKRRADGTYDSDIYYSIRTLAKDGEESWSEPVNLGPAINTGEDDAVEAISPSGGTIYFTSFRQGWVREGGPFYVADLVGTEWRNVRGMRGGITEFFKTSNLFRIYGASVGSYGDVFYFATTAHSGSDNHQIWVSHLRDGVWGYPRNLGAPVNASNGSFAPYISADGRTLYFSSNRSGGFGGEDVYVTVLRDTLWEEPINLGPSINTSGEDAFFSIPASGDRVYLSRSKDNQVTIVSTPLQEQFRPGSIVLLTGTVTDRNSGQVVDATVTIEDLQAHTTVQRSVGGGFDNKFLTILLPGRDYGISVSAPGYAFYSMRYTIPADARYREARENIQLERLEVGRSFSLNNIFFDYKSDTLNPVSYLELDRLIALLGEHPEIRIMLTGHTDNVGSPGFNEALSLRRAAAVGNYLKKVGYIPPSRIELLGAGSTMPFASNDTEEGRRMNRVVRFTILR